jgi:hypothetical protein
LDLGSIEIVGDLEQDLGSGLVADGRRGWVNRARAIMIRPKAAVLLRAPKF